MDFEHPPLAFVLVDGVIAPRLFRLFYRRYSASIPLRGNESVIDFGCGSGGISEYLAPRLRSGSLTCVDLSEPMIQIARRRLKKYEYVLCLNGRIEALPIEPDSVDVVVIHNALHDVLEEERQLTLSHLVRALRPDGRLHFREPTKPSHGLPSATYCKMMTEAGLIQVAIKEYKVFPIGAVVDAVFRKGITVPKAHRLS